MARVASFSGGAPAPWLSGAPPMMRLQTSGPPVPAPPASRGEAPSPRRGCASQGIDRAASMDFDMLFDAGAADPEVAPDALDLDPVAEDDDREKRFDSDSSGDDASDPANVYVRCAHGTARPFVPQGSTRAARTLFFFQKKSWKAAGFFPRVPNSRLRAICLANVERIAEIQNGDALAQIFPNDAQSANGHVDSQLRSTDRRFGRFASHFLARSSRAFRLCFAFRSLTPNPPPSLPSFLPLPLQNRLVKQLARPKTAEEEAVYKRLRVACAAVGAGELGDAAHVDAIRRAFNALGSDVWGEPVRLEAEASAAPTSAPTSAPARTQTLGEFPGEAFAATTPGAAGHAALLNLRHSFLWVRSGAADARGANAPRRGDFGETSGRGRRGFLASTLETPPFYDDSAEDEGEGVAASAEEASSALLLEPDIKAHFVISRPTREYRKILDALPDHFVGTHESLRRLVEFVGERMLGSFRESGMSVPPWRKPASILSKWFLPTALKKNAATSAPSTPGASPTNREGAGTRRNASAPPSRENTSKGRVGWAGAGEEIPPLGDGAGG